MNRIIEANFLPAPVEEAKEKARILIIDNSRDFTHSAKLALERTGRYSVWEENEPGQDSPNSATRPARPYSS